MLSRVDDKKRGRGWDNKQKNHSTIQMMKPQGLRGRKTVDRVRRRGTKWNGRHMKISYLFKNASSEPVLSGALQRSSAQPPQSRRAQHDIVFLGTSASLRLHKSAVKRNRMRRRCKEALRTTLQGHAKLPSCQLLMTPKSSSLSCDFSELRADAEAFFTHLSKHVR